LNFSITFIVTIAHIVDFVLSTKISIQCQFLNLGIFFCSVHVKKNSHPRKIVYEKKNLSLI